MNILIPESQKDPLSEDNFMLFCARHYDGRYLTTTEDFEEDLNRIKYIKKLITRYNQSGDLKERLILNHIIVLNNVFGPSVTCKILYLKLKKQFRHVKPFLLFLNILPSHVYNVGNDSVINLKDIETDHQITQKLTQL